MIASLRAYFERYLEQDRADLSDGHSRERLRVATAALLLEMANADFHTEPEELDAVKRAIQEELELSSADADQLITEAEVETRQSVDYFHYTNLINKACSLEEKTAIIEMMWRVALADGRVDKYEEHLIRKIANLIYVPREMIVAAKHSALRASGREQEPL
jgi:uncharacterized tellurite resistance protein B-like protein